ncbi:MAG: hypothetical protein KIT47_09380 [Rhodoferax sp.]|nr:hypothetical protein [Rhodoferax sp.]
MQRGVIFSVVGGLFLSGCATSSRDIAATDVSPLQSQAFECDQLEAEAQRLNAKVLQIGGRLDEAAPNGKSTAVVGAVPFWPARFAPGGTENQGAELARLTGERDALQQVAIRKRCDINAGGGSVTAGVSPAAVVLRPASAALPVRQAVQFPGPFGTLALTDSLTRVTRSIIVKVEESGPARTVYSTGDVIARDGTVLETRMGELVIRTESGALWAVPVRAGTQGQASFVTTLGGFKGVIRWQAVAEDQTRVRIVATTYWGGGGAGGSFVASYVPDSPVAQSFKTEISSPAAASYAQGYAPPDRTTALLTRH